MIVDMQKYNGLSNIGFLLKYLFRINKKLYLYRVPTILLNILLPLSTAYLFGKLINELTAGGGLWDCVSFVIMIVGCNLAFSLLQRFLGKIDQFENERTVLDIKLDLGKTVSALSFGDIENPRIKDFISLARDTTLFSRAINATSSLIGALIALCTYFFVLIRVQPWMILVIAVNFLVQLIVGRLKLKDNDKWRTRQEPIFRKLWYYEGVLCDPRYGKELRLNCLQRWFTEKANDVYDGECAPIVKTNSRNVNLLDMISQTVKIAETIFIYLFLALKVIFHGMPLGDFTFYLSNVTNFSNALNSLTSTVIELNECAAFIREFRFFDSIRPKPPAVPSAGKRVNAGDCSIEFENVSFKYPNTERYVLKNVSFKIRQGEKLSLVGMNGSGKTTLVKLLCRFYEPTEGKITIGQTDIGEYDIRDYNKLLGVVFQDYKLFSFSVKENITMGEKEDIFRIDRCLETCGLAEKTSTLQFGTDTFVYKDFDENGVEFSGGEGQKLAIGRALYKDAPIMILDEPNAALDPIAEYEILENISSAVKDRTAIIISHRLSTTQFTDKIAVLQDGMLVEFGSHSDLINLENGVYKEMFSIQKGNYSC